MPTKWTQLRNSRDFKLLDMSWRLGHEDVSWLKQLETGKIEVTAAVLAKMASGYQVDVKTMMEMLGDFTLDQPEAIRHEIHEVHCEDADLYVRLRGDIHVQGRGIGLGSIRAPGGLVLPLQEGFSVFHACGHIDSFAAFYGQLRLCRIPLNVLYAKSFKEEAELRR